MRKFKYSISRNALNQMYMSYRLPIVEYAPVVWDGCALNNTHKPYKRSKIKQPAFLQDYLDLYH